ncbi:MAG: choice-of-anchor Q domain-containing protein [Myxococcota bacterium]
MRFEVRRVPFPPPRLAEIVLRTLPTLVLLLAACGDDGRGPRLDASFDATVDVRDDRSLDGDVQPADARVDAACRDADRDGVSDCEGDCDDTDPLRYPDAPEICGDGVANGCGTAVDPGCMDRGTFVAPPPVGDDANPGTKTSPVATIQQGLRNAAQIGMATVVVVVAEGTYAEKVDLPNGVELRGGLTPDFSSRGEASVLSPPADPGADDVATLAVAGGVEATVRDFRVSTVASGPTHRTGVRIATDGSLTLSSVEVRCRAPERCVGIDVNGGTLAAANVEIQLSEGNERFGVSLVDAVNTTLDDVRVTADGGEDVAGFLIQGGDVESHAAIVTLDGVRRSVVGIVVSGETDTTLYNGVVRIGTVADAAGVSAGIELRYLQPPQRRPSILIHSNLLVGGAGGARSSGLAFNFNGGAVLIAGRVYNNNFRSGSGTERFAVAENDIGIDPEVFENNALYVDPGGGAAYLDEARFDLDDASEINDVGGHRDNLVENCEPQSLSGGDYRLPASSPCIDAGGRRELPPTDFLGGPRGLGIAPDIGPHEAG